MTVIAADNYTPESQYAARVGGELATLLGTSLEVVHAPEGEVVSALAAKVRLDAPELVVVGGCSEVGKASNHGHAEELAQRLACPVLVVRPDAARLLDTLEQRRPLRLLVALDRTRASDAMLRFVVALRRHRPCDMTVTYSYWPPAERERLGIPLRGEPFEGDERVTQAIEKEIRDRFAHVGGRGAIDVHVAPHIGATSVGIISDAHAAKADVVVVGSHRRDVFGRFVHGSVSRDVLRLSDVPVLCVGAESGEVEREPPLRSVLAATDFTPSGNAAVAHALRVLGEYGHLTVLYVAAQPLDGTSRPWPRDPMSHLAREELVTRLRGIVPEELPQGVRVTYLVEEEGPAALKIMQAAERLNVDLITLGSGDKHALDRVLIGSVAHDVVNRSERPVTVVKMRPL